MDLGNLFKNAETIVQLQPGAIVFAEGMPGDVMYVVLDGELEIRVADELTEIVCAGGVVGEMALVDAQARCATVTAKTACRLTPIDKHRFLFMVQETPFFSLHIMRVIVDRLRRENLRHAARQTTAAVPA